MSATVSRGYRQVVSWATLHLTRADGAIGPDDPWGEFLRGGRAPWMGPLEVLVIECPGERLQGEILLALTSAVDSGTLRIIDVTFIHKDAKGNVSSYELAELEEHELVAYDVVDETRGLLSVGDIAKICARVTPDCTAVLMVVEHAWTAHLEQAVLAANGRIVVHERVPPDVALAALEHGRSSQAGG
jgi:Family of unknown function (DUF6325)